MALRINLEIGHEASLRTKHTPEGFTHDWKIYVRGCDGAEIHHYVEKVVFYLHETFQKPKRVIKEPPYQVKESGYAGFILPIDIYLRNNGEPKKIKFNYDLTLQRTGSPVSKVRKEKYVFSSPSEDFKSKLLKGGGVVTSNSQELNESKSVLYEEKNQLISKPKLSGTDAPPRKPKIESHISNSFQDLFGPPITKTTKMPEPKAPPPPKENKVSAKPDKEKSADKVKSKHSPHKDKDKDKDREKTEKKVKEEKKRDKEKKDRDRERSKEKSFKKDKSPKPRSPSPRHPSPKPSSPTPQPLCQPTSAGKSRDKETKGEKEKKDKADKEEKKAKKEKKEKDYAKDKEKYRDSNKSDHKNKETKPKEIVPPPKEPEIPAPAPVVPTASPPQIKQEKKDRLKEDDKLKTDRIDKPEDKKHKHKKKDKNKKDRKEKEEKSHKPVKKPEKEKSMTSVQAAPSSTATSVNGSEMTVEKNMLFGNSPKTETSSVTSSPKEKDKAAKPLNKLFHAFLDESSDSSPSSREQSPVPDAKKKEKVKKNDKKTTDKDQEKKKKRKSSSDLDQPPEKVVKDEENPETSSDQEVNNQTVKTEPTSTEPDDYMSVLRSLQHKIMALKDNADLQKVVQLIAETGQYEISAHTFDFDLCLLDRSTVRQLQDFLSTTS